MFAGVAVPGHRGAVTGMVGEPDWRRNSSPNPLARMQKAEMRRIDIAFQRLQPVAFPLPAREIRLVRRQQRRLESGQWGYYFALAHIDVDQAAALGPVVNCGRYISLK